MAAYAKEHLPLYTKTITEKLTVKRPTYAYLTGLLWLILPVLLYAQKPADTLDFYSRLQNKADKHKVTKWIYDAMFTDMNNVSDDTVIYTKSSKTQNAYLKYKGKIVRNITIVSLDPFGYSVNDTTEKNLGKLQSVANKYHIDTRKHVIRNLLLFKPDKELDPLEISESERVLRSSPYVNDARIYIRTLSGKKKMSDSVDVVVVVQDKWTTILGSSFDMSLPNIVLIERNIFGLGHQFEENFQWDPVKSHLGTSGKYSIFNIRNSFITSTAYYSSLKDFSQVGVSLDRPFYSPLARWAGGVTISHTNDTYIYYPDPETQDNELKYPLNYDIQDLWFAKNIPLTEKKSSSIDKRSKSFTAGVRYYHKDIVTRPSFDIDTSRINRSQYMYLANAGFTQRKFYRDRYLYRFGANEDIPEGFLTEATQGIFQREFSSLWYYSGLRIASGKRYDMGYFAAGIGYGTFYNKTFTGLGVLNADAFYFSNLIKGGRWFFREFTRFQFVHGIDRESYEKININGIQMYGFSSPVLAAQSKLILNLEFVMYAPYELIGFKFAPVLLCGLAKLGNGMGDLMSGRTYQSYALGVLIRNEHLVTNTFEISIGLYPFVPGEGSFLTRFNPISSYTIRARDYVVAKPDLIPYQ